MLSIRSLLGWVASDPSGLPRADHRLAAAGLDGCVRVVFETLEARAMMNDMLQFGVALGFGGGAFLPAYAQGRAAEHAAAAVLDQSADDNLDLLSAFPEFRNPSSSDRWASFGARPGGTWANQRAVASPGWAGATATSSERRRSPRLSEGGAALSASPVGPASPWSDTAVARAARPAHLRPGVTNRPVRRSGRPAPAAPANPPADARPAPGESPATPPPPAPVVSDPNLASGATTGPVVGPAAGLGDLGDSAPVVGPVLTPGTGFSGLTPEPAPVGTGAGADAKAIARWDVVPYQTFTGTFNVGVVAFHMNGIDRVEFSLNGGNWIAVRSMAKNPQTDVYEYYATLDAKTLPDGPVEIRAIAYPKSGKTRVLDSLTLFANAKGSLAAKSVYVSLGGNDTAAGTQAAPVRTIDRAIRLVRQNGGANDGRIVLLDEGFYELPYYSTGTDAQGSTNTVNDRWLTITSAEGLNRDAVILGRPVDGTTVRMRVSRMKLQSVSIDFTTVNQFYVGPEDGIWFDNTRWFSTNSGDTQRNYPVRATTNSFVTNSEAHDLLYGFVGLTGVRNVKLVNVRGDSLAGSQLVINVEVSAVHGSGGSDFHSDILQYSGSAENLIVYGVRALQLDRVQVLFLEPTIYSTLGQPQNTMTNAAFVNLDIDYAGDPNSPPYSQMISRFEHVVFKNVNMPKQRLIPRTDITTNNQAWYSHDVLFDGCSFYEFPTTMPDGVEWR